MTISKTVFIILAVTVVIGLIIMATAWLWMRKKTKKIKHEYAKTNIPKNNKPRENYGKLLWELKAKSINPLEDEQLEFIINTAWMNGYKTFKTINFDSQYESTSLVKLIKMSKQDTNPELIVIDTNKEFDKLFDHEYKLAKKQTMFILANADRKNKKIKNTMSYLKTIKAKYEWQNYGKGIILVVK